MDLGKMASDLTALAELLHMVSIYRRRGFPDLAIKLLQEIVDLEEQSAHPNQRILALARYNLAELYADGAISWFRTNCTGRLPRVGMNWSRATLWICSGIQAHCKSCKKKRTA